MPLGYAKLRMGRPSSCSILVLDVSISERDVTGDKAEVDFTYKRIQALQEFFNAIDSLTRAVVKLESLGFTNVKTILSVLK